MSVTSDHVIKQIHYLYVHCNFSEYKIATELKINRATVKNHVTDIMRMARKAKKHDNGVLDIPPGEMDKELKNLFSSNAVGSNFEPNKDDNVFKRGLDIVSHTIHQYELKIKAGNVLNPQELNKLLDVMERMKEVKENLQDVASEKAARRFMSLEELREAINDPDFDPFTDDEELPEFEDDLTQ